MRNTTLTLPDPQFVEDCGKGGNLTFVDGAAKVGKATWSIGMMTPIEGELDGVPGAELVTTLSCSEQGSVFGRGHDPGGAIYPLSIDPI